MQLPSLSCICLPTSSYKRPQPMKIPKLGFQWARFRRHFTRFTWGGAWAAVLPDESQRNLTLFFYNGLFAAASDKIILTYTTIYLLSMGASGQQIGLLSSLSNLAAAILLLPAALLIERTGQRKQIFLTSAGGTHVVVFIMALLPIFLMQSSALIWLLLGLALLRETLVNIGYPGWMALTGDLVPVEGRGRYFGARNFIMGIAGILTALLVGEGITRMGEPLGYQIAFGLAIVMGIVSLLFFSRLKDPQRDENRTIHEVRSGIASILASLKGQRSFFRFCLFTAFWNFSINISGPFFNVYMVDTLKMTAALIGVTAVANTVANLLVQRRIGLLSDIWGNRKVAVVFMLLIPFVGLIWGLWVRHPWQAILMEAVSGLLWGAYNLASFNNILIYTPEAQRARFTAFYQIVVTLSLAGGAALGSLLIPRIEFRGVTMTSALGRWFAVALFLLFVHDPQLPDEKSDHLAAD